jgi:hypothetical protein
MPIAKSLIGRVFPFLGRRFREAGVIGQTIAIDRQGSRLRRAFLHPFLFNTVSFFALSLLAFRHNAKLLFFGFDGRFEISWIAQQTAFVRPMLGFSGDFLHGLGNVWFAVNPWLIPGYFFALDAPGDFTNFPLAYAWCATEFFAAIYVLGRLMGIPVLAAVAAGWLAPLLAFQYAGGNLVPSTFRGFPHYATIDAVMVLSAAALVLIGRYRLQVSLIVAGACFLGISYVVAAAPTLLILCAPQFIAFGIVSLFLAHDRGQVLTKLCLIAGIAILCLLLGYAHFILGLVTYTAADVFQGLSLRAEGLREASLLFVNIGWPPTLNQLLQIYRVFIFSGLVGGLWSAFSGRDLERAGAIGFLGLAGSFLVLGIIHSVHPFWFGPAFWYFEDFLFPYYAIFAVLLLWRLWRFGWLILGAVRGWRPLIAMIEATASPPVLVAILAIYPWYYIVRAEIRIGQINPPFYEPYPQPETPISQILKSDLALRPGEPFRGRAVELAGRIFPTSTKMTVARLWDAPYLLSLHATGNAHRSEAFSQDSIPGLLEYNPLMTPPYFAFMRRFLTEPGDLQIRNLLGMRRIDPRILAALGVRYFVTDRSFDDDRARLRQVLPVAVSSEFVRQIGEPRSIEDFSLYLYEVERANLGQYSPTEIRLAVSANAMLAALADPALDLSRYLVTAEDLDRPLVPAQLDEFLIGRGSYVVRGRSAGRSVLLLPMEYSNCLHVADADGNITPPRLFRADLLLTGILFDRTLDVKIAYHTGPIIDSRCRLRDAEDMVRLKMKDAFADHPELQPLNMDVDD